MHYSPNVFLDPSDAATQDSESAEDRTEEGTDGERYRTQLDLSGQVLSIDLDAEPEKDLDPNFKKADPDFVSAAVLSWKAKEFDDGLFAAVEIAADQGVGTFPSRQKLLEDILHGLAEAGGPRAAAGATAGGTADARTFIEAALVLGGADPAACQRASAGCADPPSDAAKLPPLGFYSWTQPLSRIYRRNRWLHSGLADPVASRLARVIAHDDRISKAYAASVELLGKMTNPPSGRDLGPLVETLRLGAARERHEVSAFWADSRSPEAQIVTEMPGPGTTTLDGGAIFEGGGVMDELIRRVGAGSLSLQLRPDSGWYDHQLFALEPLLAPERTAEASRLAWSETYREALRALFRASYVSSRETHLASLGWAKAIGLRILPRLSVEPLPTYYERRADSYRFVRSALESIFGREALVRMHRLSIVGEVDLPLSEELPLMESIFRGAGLVARTELGLAQGREPTRAPSPSAEVAVFRRWAKTVAEDPDLARDVRVMVPFAQEGKEQKFRVSLVLGVHRRDLTACYRTPPVVNRVLAPSGKALRLKDVKIRFECAAYSAEGVVSAEAVVSRLMTREEFARHCDRFETVDAILANLERAEQGPIQGNR